MVKNVKFELQVEKYSPNSGQWTAVTSMLTQRCRLGVATLNGRLYVCGGYDGSTFLETVEEYDPMKDKWVIIPDTKKWGAYSVKFV